MKIDLTVLPRLQAQFKKVNLEKNRIRWEAARQWQELCWAPAGVRARYRRKQAQEDRIIEKIFCWLDKHSPRQWRENVPFFYVCTDLTVEQALAQYPTITWPPCYGQGASLPPLKGE